MCFHRPDSKFRRFHLRSWFGTSLETCTWCCSRLLTHKRLASAPNRNFTRPLRCSAQDRLWKLLFMMQGAWNRAGLSRRSKLCAIAGLIVLIWLISSWPTRLMLLLNGMMAIRCHLEPSEVLITCTATHAALLSACPSHAVKLSVTLSVIAPRMEVLMTQEIQQGRHSWDWPCQAWKWFPSCLLDGLLGGFVCHSIPMAARQG